MLTFARSALVSLASSAACSLLFSPLSPHDTWISGYACAEASMITQNALWRSASADIPPVKRLVNASASGSVGRRTSFVAEHTRDFYEVNRRVASDEDEEWRFGCVTDHNNSLEHKFEWAAQEPSCLDRAELLAGQLRRRLSELARIQHPGRIVLGSHAPIIRAGLHASRIGLIVDPRRSPARELEILISQRLRQPGNAGKAPIRLSTLHR